ncbi:hypothetical protein [Halobacteriovorax sp.]|uniref:hypothetical protein n=1 Tax=Halobacteriovorax sp. TaxID=2020862 RepID=UPI00356244E7
MNKVLLITNFINGLLLVRFSLSKLFAWPISVKAFIEMAKPLGIDPTFFRLFTGVIITSICLGYFANFYLIISKKAQVAIKGIPFIQLSNIVGIGVMIGALISEFALREVPKWPLVIIASVIILFSILNLAQFNKLLNKK